MDCGFCLSVEIPISTACTAAQLKNPAHVDVAVAPKVCTLYFGAFQGAPNRCDQIHMEGASHVSPGISIVGIETVVEKLDKR